MTTTFDILRRPLVTEKTNYQVSKLTPVCVRSCYHRYPHSGEGCRGINLQSDCTACEYYQYRR